MAHDINRMIYVGAEPWHGLGVRLPVNASYEEIVDAAGFYEAREQPVYLPGRLDPVPDKKALVRGDTGAYLSVVGKSYKVVQFAEVARTLVEAAGEVKAIFHTAGTLGESGARGWLLGELPDPLVVRGDASPIRKYVLGTAGHDGVTAVVIKNVATRVVCANTLGVALGERDGAEWRIHHTASAHDRLEEAARAFRRIQASYERLGELANRMVGIPFTDQQMAQTVDMVLPVPQDDQDHTRLLAGRNKVIELFSEGAGITSRIRGSAWAGFQACVEYLDHYRPIRVTKGQDPRLLRLESVWTGRAAALKQVALTAIAEEAGLPLAA
jgi:phage/plasmid-like protein (TIGR03299 family)